jgi:hypothetical protein
MVSKFSIGWLNESYWFVDINRVLVSSKRVDVGLLGSGALKEPWGSEVGGQ